MLPLDFDLRVVEEFDLALLADCLAGFEDSIALFDVDLLRLDVEAPVTCVNLSRRFPPPLMRCPCFSVRL